MALNNSGSAVPAETFLGFYLRNFTLPFVYVRR